VLRRPAAVFAGVTSAALLLDQASKQLVRTFLSPPGTSVVFMTVSVLVLLAIAVYLVRVRPRHPLLVFALGLVTAGAAGNLIDRAVSGRVTDFIQVPFDFPVFNLADSAIFVGVAMLVWWVLFGPAEHGAASGRAPDGDATLIADQPGLAGVSVPDESAERSD
jgi:lipoprotein signal peptidase